MNTSMDTRIAIGDVNFGTPNSSKPKTDDDTKGSNSIQSHPVEVGKLSEELNTYLNESQTCLVFVLHEGSDNQVVMAIKNRKTGEIIRQIPSEELLKIREKMVESAGLLFDWRI